MKRATTYSYTFAPGAVPPTLNLSGITNFNIRKLYAVIDLTAGSILFWAGLPQFGYSVLTSTTLTLKASVAGCQSTDDLMVIYDDGDLATAAASQPSVLTLGGALVASGNPLPAVDSAAATILNSILTAEGAVGTSPPTLASGASGVLGMLRLLSSLLPNANGSLVTAGHGLTVASASFTRPANTTAYSAGGLVANSVTAGSVVPMAFTVQRAAGLTFNLQRARLQKTGTTNTNADFSLYLFSVSPTVVNGDGGAFSCNESLAYLGKIDITTMPDVFTDGCVGIGVAEVGDIYVNPVVQEIFGLLVAEAAYTPASAEVFTVFLEGLMTI